jgi:hypothetical protein
MTAVCPKIQIKAEVLIQNDEGKFIGSVTVDGEYWEKDFKMTLEELQGLVSANALQEIVEDAKRKAAAQASAS